MSEWKKYDETEYTDFGSVGETMPVSGSDYNAGYGQTTMEGFDDVGVKTIPDDPGPADTDFPEEPGSAWMEAPATAFEQPDIVNETGEHVRPATGWLVCIDGVTKGVDYRIYAGYTYVGRDPAQNQVAIPDQRISSVPSARILYDVESRKFYLNETNGAKNPVYLNGNLFDGRVELHGYDIIKLGTTKLLFVPLCTEKFSWGDE